VSSFYFQKLSPNFRVLLNKNEMAPSIIIQATQELCEQKKLRQSKWQRVVLLIVLGYEAAGCLLGGSLLMVAPDGRLMDMPVKMMHNVFADFLVPGIILFGLGILNAAAFVAVLRRTRFDWVLSGLSLGGLVIWFWVEITILQQLHWLHALWGLPVIFGGLAALPLVPFQRAEQKALLICGILSSLVYATATIVCAIFYEGYSAFSQTVSELSAIGAPTRPLWLSLVILYSLFVIAFGAGVWQAGRGKPRLRVVGALLIADAVIGFFWPPMHQREVLAAGGGTISDTLHIVFTFITVSLMMLAIGFGASASGKKFRIYSIVTLVILAAAGIMTGMAGPKISENLPTPWIGVWERINIGIYMLWIVVFAIKLLLMKEKEQQSMAKPPEERTRIKHVRSNVDGVHNLN
jgi:hypothetical protein